MPAKKRLQLLNLEEQSYNALRMRLHKRFKL